MNLSKKIEEIRADLICQGLPVDRIGVVLDTFKWMLLADRLAFPNDPADITIVTSETKHELMAHFGFTLGTRRPIYTIFAREMMNQKHPPRLSFNETPTGVRRIPGRKQVDLGDSARALTTAVHEVRHRVQSARKRDLRIITAQNYWHAKIPLVRAIGYGVVGMMRYLRHQKQKEGWSKRRIHRLTRKTEFDAIVVELFALHRMNTLASPDVLKAFLSIDIASDF